MFGYLSRLLFALFLLFSAYVTFQNLEESGSRFIERYDRFQTLVAQNYQFTLPHSNLLVEHKDNIQIGIIAIQAIAAIGVFFSVNVLAYLYILVIIPTIAILHNPLTTMAANKHNMLFEVLKDIGIIGILIMITCQPTASGSKGTKTTPTTQTITQNSTTAAQAKKKGKAAKRD